MCSRNLKYFTLALDAGKWVIATFSPTVRSWLRSSAYASRGQQGGVRGYSA